MSLSQLLSKAHQKGLQLSGRISFTECEIAAKVARAIRIYGQAQGIEYLDSVTATLIYRLDDVLHNGAIGNAMLRPGGGFGKYQLDWAKLQKELRR